MTFCNRIASGRRSYENDVTTLTPEARAELKRAKGGAL